MAEIVLPFTRIRLCDVAWRHDKKVVTMFATFFPSIDDGSGIIGPDMRAPSVDNNGAQHILDTMHFVCNSFDKVRQPPTNFMHLLDFL